MFLPHSLIARCPAHLVDNQIHLSKAVYLSSVDPYTKRLCSLNHNGNTEAPIR